MSEDTHQRIVLLNHLFSRSKSRAPHEHRPPLIPAADLIDLVRARYEARSAIEYFGRILEEDKEDDDDNEADDAPFHGAGLDFMRLKDFKYIEFNGRRYGAFLFEYVNQRIRSLPVVHTQTFEGREIEGEEEERGGMTAHFVVRLPGGQDYDDGTYRCCVEAGTGVTRSQITRFLRRQIAKAIGKEKWSFEVVVPGKKGRSKTHQYRYWPRLELVADVGRSLGAFNGEGRTLTHLVFTKRSERQEIGGPTSVKHDDFVADVEIKVSARQGPTEAGERVSWFSRIRASYEARGFETRLFYRTLNGGQASGGVHQSLDGAADLMMCPKEVIELQNSPKVWAPRIDDTIIGKMVELTEKDQLWERRK